MNGFERKGLKGSYLKPLTGEEIERLHRASLEVLEKTGIVVYEESALEKLREAGCQVEEGKKLVKIPPALIEKALEKAPGTVALYGRGKEKTIRLGEGRVYARTPGGATHILDLETGVPRKATSKDVAEGARLADALPNIHGLSMFQVVPGDVPVEVVDLYAAEISFNHTEKHLFYVCHNQALIEDVLAMAACVAGGYDALSERPLLSALCESTSPLRIVESQARVIEAFATRGLPLMVHAHPIAGFTSPVTLAGELAITNAEILSLICVAQLFREGTPVVYGMSSSVPEMRSGLNLAGAVEIGLLGAAVAQLAHHYGLPCAMTSGLDAQTPGGRAVLERVMTALPPILAGIDLVNLSTLRTKMAFCLEQLVIDNDILDWCARYLQGIGVDDETLALELIHEVGPGGSFINRTHTLEHFRKELLLGGLLREKQAGNWREKARSRVQELLRTHWPQALPEETRKELAGLRSDVECRGEKKP